MLSGETGLLYLLYGQ